MNLKQSLELEHKKHELKMIELAYERETQLQAIEHAWKVENQPQQNYYPQQQPQLPPAPQPPQPRQAGSEIDQSKQKYGGK